MVSPVALEALPVPLRWVPVVVRRRISPRAIVDHKYEIEADGTKVAEISMRWVRVRDTYGIEIAPGQDDVVVLAVAVDAMADGVG